MAKVNSSNAVMMTVVVLVALAMSAQSIEMAPTPAPSFDTGAAFSLPVSGSIIGFSLVLSLLSLLKL
ncbi:hypothetical protein Patl1_20585 [Pistacia atlantica]|uniref:Uncharacterized protein n=1 Tax=Pistacia atlantica TaxID=434234 RepID=A0ACC1BK45_9ROSI|nr:hypothetical protein Patl1_20585 [Pistacia atlantica]